MQSGNGNAITLDKLKTFVALHSRCSIEDLKDESSYKIRTHLQYIAYCNGQYSYEIKEKAETALRREKEWMQ